MLNNPTRTGWSAETLLILVVLCGGIVGCQMERTAPDDWPLKRDPRFQSQGGSETGEGFGSVASHPLSRATAAPSTPSPAVFHHV